MSASWQVDYSTRIPNNVNLADDRRVLRALEEWHPGYLNWWRDMGPEGFQESLVYLRTAVTVDPKGWAKFDYVRMPEYRWGILLAPAEEGRMVPFGDRFGRPSGVTVAAKQRWAASITALMSGVSTIMRPRVIEAVPARRP